MKMEKLWRNTNKNFQIAVQVDKQRTLIKYTTRLRRENFHIYSYNEQTTMNEEGVPEVSPRPGQAQRPKANQSSN